MTRRAVHSFVLVLAMIPGVSTSALAQDVDTPGVPRRPEKTVPLELGTSWPPGTVRPLYTNLPGDPTADVPGLPGVHFGPGTGTTHFDRIFGSPNGHWAIVADTDLATTEDEILFVDDVVLAREGTPTPWSPTENFGVFDTSLGVSDSGVVVFANNTDNPTTTADEYILGVASGVDAFIVAQEGQPVGAALPGATWGSTLDSPKIAATTNEFAFSSDAVLGVPTTEDELVIANDILVAQEGVTVPTGQTGAEFWENFDIDDLWVDAAGMSFLVQGDLAGATTADDVVVVDGGVVVQEGVILPGSGFAEPVDAEGIVGVHMAPDGTWYVRGNNDVTELDWVFSNSGVVTSRGEPIHAGATELWSDAEFADCYFLHVGDGNGNFVIGGVSDGPATSNGVLVLNDTWVIAREGQPFDLDGNGLFDDDTFFNTFGNDDGYLSDGGYFYFTATIQDGADVTIGQGLFRIDLRCLLGILPFTDDFESGDTSAWCAVQL
ncbi:MAG: hypothetical protein AMXMBFR36_34720 [Acidobacteriota bacterium]